MQFGSSLDSEIKAQDLCQQPDFQALLAEEEATLVITDSYVFEATDVADQALLQDALQTDFSFTDSLNICQRFD